MHVSDQLHIPTTLSPYTVLLDKRERNLCTVGSQILSVQPINQIRPGTKSDHFYHPKKLAVCLQKTKKYLSADECTRLQV